MLVTFYEANTQVISEKKNGSVIFREFTQVMGQVLELLDKIPIEVDDLQKVTLMTMPELASYNFSFSPLCFGTFLRLNKLLVHKQNTLKC